MEVVVDESLQSIMRVGVVVIDNMQPPGDGGEAIWQMFNALSNTLRDLYSGKNVSEVPGVQGARTLYRAVGLDPTKTRPSSEALLRRSIKGKGVYRIHPLVDLLNFISMKTMIPIGLYDTSKIAGNTVRIQIGDNEWGFDGIRKARVNVTGRLCVADDIGPFGSPTSDSLRTSIEGDVPAALVLLYQAISDSATHLSEAIALVKSLISLYMRGNVSDMKIV